jgi:hypothetical protein
VITLAGGGQANTLADLQGQAQAQGVFQQFHLLADGTGRDTQTLGGLDNAAETSHGFKNLQRAQKASCSSSSP